MSKVTPNIAKNLRKLTNLWMSYGASRADHDYDHIEYSCYKT